MRRLAVKGKGVEDDEELALLVPEMGLHDRTDAVEVAVELVGIGTGVHGDGEPADEVLEHVVVAHEVGDHRFEVGVFGDDLREQPAVLAAVVAAESRAEAAAEQEEVLPGGLLEFPVDGSAGEVERLAQALVDIAKLGAERDQAVGVGTD